MRCLSSVRANSHLEAILGKRGFSEDGERETKWTGAHPEGAPTERGNTVATLGGIHQKREHHQCSDSLRNFIFILKRIRSRNQCDLIDAMSRCSVDRAAFVLVRALTFLNNG